MKRLITALYILMILSCNSSDTIKREYNISDNWNFHLDDQSKTWEEIDLPHDWSIEGPVLESNPSGAPGGFFPGGIGWYRKELDLDLTYSDKKIYLLFDGVSQNSTVYINGIPIGTHFNGYNSHYYDITHNLKLDGNDIIEVKVDSTIQPNDRWYSGSGIYRDVKLIITEKIHIPIWGTYITTPVITDKKATVKVKTRIDNDTEAPTSIQLETKIYNSAHKLISRTVTEEKIHGKSELSILQEIDIENPKLWSPKMPELYNAVSSVLIGGEVKDRYETTFGIRNIEFNKESGFLLNGEKVILKGVNIHHDGGSVGAAVPIKIWEQRLQTLKEIGCNALRLSHNPHSPELLDLADRMGFLIYNEMYDKWSIQPHNKTVPEEHNFDNTWEHDLENFILRDRNHPSVIIWSVGNEVFEQKEQPEKAVELLTDMVDYVHKLDPTREVTAGLHPNYSAETPSRMIHYMDIISYNYQTAQFSDWYRDNPDYRFIVSETMQYREDFSWSYDLDEIDFSGNSWFLMEENVAGQFIWSGIDYLGESAGWPDKGLKCGIIQTNGFRKTSSYFTESIYSEEPMVHLAVTDNQKLEYYRNNKIIWHAWHGAWVSDHWTFPQEIGNELEVFAFTNCDEAELFQDEKSLGTRYLKDSDDQVLRWNVQYRPGELKVVAKNDGRVVAKHQLQTAQEADNIRLKTDFSDEILLVEVEVVDRNGVLVPDATNKITYSISGPGKIIGIDNGDLSDTTSYLKTTQKVMGGKTLVIVETTGKTGLITLTADSDGIKSMSTNIRIK